MPAQPTSNPGPGDPAETIILKRKARPEELVASEPKTAPTNGGGPQPIAPGLLYLALGDSYTIGEKVTGAERFPGQLAIRLRTAGVEMRSPQIVARTGWTTADLWTQVALGAPGAPQGTYDLVTLLIGVNNQYRGLSLDTYRREFEMLAARAVELTAGDPGRVIVLSIPDWGVTPYARNFDRALIRQQIDKFNQVNREIAAAHGTRYVNLTPLTRKCGDDPALISADGLHPAAKQYAQWVDLLFPEALSALRQ